MTPLQEAITKAAQTANALRIKGSCRFPTYFKAQHFDKKNCAWIDVQKQFHTAEKAREIFGAGTWRVMEISMTGRRPI